MHVYLGCVEFAVSEPLLELEGGHAAFGLVTGEGVAQRVGGDCLLDPLCWLLSPSVAKSWQSWTASARKLSRMVKVASTGLLAQFRRPLASQRAGGMTAPPASPGADSAPTELALAAARNPAIPNAEKRRTQL